ncbi:MAG: Type 1 glutamine amidotransferase-like domain-containing protein [Myxococcota bacterium]
MPAPVLVLGPQRPEPNLGPALARAQIDGRLALITAGWRHDEDEIGPLGSHLGRPLTHLKLYRWIDEVLREHPDLAQAYGARQRRIRAYKEVYRISLRAASMAVTELYDRVKADPSVYGLDLQDAIGAVHQIDERVLRRAEQITEDHPEVREPWTHPAVAALRERVLGELHGCSALLIAGGHVAVLRNRIRFLGLDSVISELPAQGVAVAAWSAGAMVLARRIVLFYDDPPEGHGMAEVLGPGLDMLPNVVWLPHARMRLDLSDDKRVAVLARRLEPDSAVALETGAHLVWDGERYTDHSEAASCFSLTASGATEPGIRHERSS